ncbi:MAG: hypothetical protein ACE5H4_13540 [Candidatus Thorarchaeota archaeon]
MAEPIVIRKEPIIKRILSSGSASRTLLALAQKPQRGMTINEIAEATGLSPVTVRKKGVEKLFSFQMIDRFDDPKRGRVFKLKPKGVLVKEANLC